MKIHTSVRYGLRALIEIGKNSTPLLQKEISKNQDIPLNYLDEIISGLKNAGLISNYGGRGSGYILAKSPANISVYMAYRAFSPDLQLVNCTCETNECKRTNVCPAKDFWFELNTQIREIMTQTSIESFLEKENIINETN
ncbi:MAG: RrF2 family transcriptional regulator [Bacteroidales bacterium]